MSSRQTANWISLSDMMTGLMLIFMLIAILTISQVVAEEQDRQKIVTEYDLSKEEIYEDLQTAFSGKEEEWGIEINRDLTIKFQNPDVLFGYLSADISQKFAGILDDFIPQYLKIINNPKYADKIKEVRIEGHTADWNDYIFSIELSQNRSNAVLMAILNNSYFNSLPPDDKAKIKFWLTSNGMGNGRTIDSDGSFTYLSGKEISSDSRRVEFRIVTNSEELIEKIINSQ